MKDKPARFSGERAPSVRKTARLSGRKILNELLILLTAFIMLAMTSCLATGGGENYFWTESGLNDLRPIFGEWDYVAVAGDRIFDDCGYVTFARAVSHAEGEEISDENVFFARSDEFAYGVYFKESDRANDEAGKNKNAEFCAFYLPYLRPYAARTVPVGSFSERRGEAVCADGNIITVSVGGRLYEVDFSADNPACTPVEEARFPEEEDEKIEYSLNGGIAQIVKDGAVCTFTASDIRAGVPEVAAAVEARKNAGQNIEEQIVSIRVCGGELFAVVEDEPDGFAAFRDVNDGLPPIAVRVDISADGRAEFSFAALADFTGYSLYKIVKK